MGAIYTRQKTQYKDSFASDTVAMSLAGNLRLVLGVVQQLSGSFAQQVARIYDISNGGLSNGNVPVYYVGGRTQGQAQINRILGPQSGAICEFYTQLGNVCSPQDLVFDLTAGCDRGSTSSQSNGAQAASSVSKVIYTLQAALMTNMAFNVSAQDMMVNESITLMFANLECDAG